MTGSTRAPVLVRGLVDDAAVFPPGNLPLAEAVAAHAVHESAPYAAIVGPLLVPVGALAEVSDLVRRGTPRLPLPVGAVARPGTALQTVVEGLASVDPSVVRVVGVEVPADLDRSALLATTVPLTVEVRRGDGQADDLDLIGADRMAGHAVQAKFRTGATPTWPWPDEDELAGFIVSAVSRGLPFKLTGGLHHVVRGAHAPATGAPAEEQHGLLNVLLAVHEAHGNGTVESVASVLAQRRTEDLAADIRRLHAPDVAAIRASFTAYGCCGVTDPITELADLGLLEDNPT